MTEGADPAAAEELAGRLWSWSSRWHPGELAWLWRATGPGAAGWRTATWRAGGRTVAWARSTAPGRLDLQADTGHDGLASAVLDWFEDGAAGHDLAVTVLDRESSLREVLLSRGYSPDGDAPSFLHLRRRLAAAPPPAPVPPGYVLRSVAGVQDGDARAALHRAAFATPEPTAATYQAVMAHPSYRAPLDRFVVAPDGTPAAAALGWLDERSGVLALEPVGTHPRFRRRGLARACVLAVLGAAVELGATHARVCARDGAADPAPRATYEAVGFRPYARNVRLVRPAR